MHSFTRTALVLSFALSLPAQAVVIATDDGSGNTTSPTDDPGFDHVAIVNGASGIYIANQWVLTAYHVASSQPASVSFGGVSYTTEPNTWQRLTNNGESGMSATTDIVMFRLASDLGLNDLEISSSVPGSGSDLIMAGNGRNRVADEIYWDSDWNETTSSNATYTGFKTTSTHTVRWGENDVAGTDQNVSIGYGDVKAFYTTFDKPGGYFGGGGFDDEAQAVVGDSGGAVFYKNGATWEISGMIDAVGTFSGQPSNTAVYPNGLSKNTTYAADLSFYRDQIVAIVAVPEPSVASLALLSTLALLRRRRRVDA